MAQDNGRRGGGACREGHRASRLLRQREGRLACPAPSAFPTPSSHPTLEAPGCRLVEDASEPEAELGRGEDKEKENENSQEK